MSTCCIYIHLGECNTPGIDDKYRNFVSEHLLLNSAPGQHVQIPVIDVNVLQDRIQQLKFRKAVGHDNVLNEHLIYAGPNLCLCHLCLLFNAILRHSYVPSSFRYGIVKPTLKISMEIIPALTCITCIMYYMYYMY